MTKQEFLNGLAAALSMSGSDKLIEDNRVFYEEYISVEITKGRTEAEVIEELGEPRLIANSILQAEGYKDIFAEGTKTYTAYDTPDGDPTTFAQGREYKGKSFEEQKQDEENKAKREEKMQKAGSSAKSVIKIILIVAVVVGVIALIIKAGVGFIRVFWPILLPVVIIALLFRIFRR
ncbi:MAG: DUF1700 domain-containing protein [Lachnospiraceae bacterium]|nr:DUF1700 domain-containing protein [Lachnospiraceae bacterium]